MRPSAAISYGELIDLVKDAEEAKDVSDFGGVLRSRHRGSLHESGSRSMGIADRRFQERLRK